MNAIVVDRTHPPSRLVYDDGARRLELRPWTYTDAGALLAPIDAGVAELAPFCRGSRRVVEKCGFV